MTNGYFSSLIESQRLRIGAARMILPDLVIIVSKLERYPTEERSECKAAVKLGLDHSYFQRRGPDYNGTYTEFYTIGRKIGEKCIEADRAESRN